MWLAGGVPMALKPKRRSLVVCCLLAVTALTMLRLGAAVPQEVRSRIAAAVQIHTRVGNIDKKPLRYIKDPNPAWSSIAVNAEDRKSTRLNSSHRTISYAVFCLKNKISRTRSNLSIHTNFCNSPTFQFPQDVTSISVATRIPLIAPPHTVRSHPAEHHSASP